MAVHCLSAKRHAPQFTSLASWFNMPPMPTNFNLPAGAWKSATHRDRAQAQRALDTGSIQITWPTAIRGWARRRGWRTPWYGFRTAFLRQMFESDDNFRLALQDGGVRLLIPVERFTVPDRRLREFDALYEERTKSGRPTGWGPLVAALRELRRLVEAGIIVEIDGQTLKSWGGFYTWAHGRYHMLEDGYDSWIGDDKS